MYLNFNLEFFIVLKSWEALFNDVNHLHPSMNKFVCFSPAPKVKFLVEIERERERKRNMKIMDLGEGCHQVGKMAKEWQKRYKKKKKSIPIS